MPRFDLSGMGMTQWTSWNAGRGGIASQMVVFNFRAHPSQQIRDLDGQILQVTPDLTTLDEKYDQTKSRLILMMMTTQRCPVYGYML
jgi:hypothetical protein